jgi:hypothetical protein
MQQHADGYEDNYNGAPVDQIILVGHNRKVFDLPFLIHQMCEHRIADRVFQDGRFSLGIDTLNVARKGICNDKSGFGVPSAYNLPTLYQFVTGLLPSTWHCAMADTKATATLFCFPVFWETRTECVFDFLEREWEIQDAIGRLNRLMILILIQVTANLQLNLFLPHHQVQMTKKAIMFH